MALPASGRTRDACPMTRSSVQASEGESHVRRHQLREALRVGRWIGSLAVVLAVAEFLGPYPTEPSAEHVDARWLAMLLVVLTTADVGGFAAGVVAVVVAAVAIDLWIVAPGDSALVPPAHDAVALALFVVAAVTGGALITRARPAIPTATALTAPQRDPDIEPITDRELGVLELLNLGLSNDDIARRLVVSPNTVKSHLEHLYGKLGVSSRGRAVAEGHRRGLIGEIDRE